MKSAIAIVQAESGELKNFIVVGQCRCRAVCAKELGKLGAAAAVGERRGRAIIRNLTILFAFLIV